MIPNHPQFLEALAEKKKVRVSYYSKADDGVLDRVCAPVRYGPGGGYEDDLNRYWLWDYASSTGAHTVGLLPQQVIELKLLNEPFEPAELLASETPGTDPEPAESPALSALPPAPPISGPTAVSNK